MGESKETSAILTRGPIGRTLLRLTGPMVWGMLAFISMNLVDIYFIAQLGKEELAAMSFALPIVMVLMNFSFGLSVGTGSVLSRSIGRGDQEKVRHLTSSSFLLALGLMTGFSVIGYTTIDQLFTRFNAPVSVMPLIHAYMEVWYLGLPVLGLAMIGNTAMTSAGDMRLPAGIMIVVSLFNLAMDPVLIFGLFGFPRLEMQGAALATVLSYGFASVISLTLVGGKKRMLAWRFPFKELIASWKAILDVSIPAASSQMIVPVTAALTVWILSHFGSEVVAGYGIVSRLEAFALILTIGLSNSIAPFVGQNWGAGYYERAQKSVSLGYKFALGWGAVAAVLLAIGYRFIPKLFIDDSGVVNAVAQYLLTVPISYGAVGSLFITNAFLNAIGFSRTVAAITIVRYFVLYLPLAFLAMRYAGPEGVFLAIALTNLLMGLGAFFWARWIVGAHLARLNQNEIK